MRDLYPSSGKYARTGVGGGTGVRPDPPSPTAAPPGSAAKVEALAARAAAGVALWHPKDARIRD